MKRMLGVLGFLIMVSPVAWSADDLMSRQMVDQAREWSHKGRDDLAAPVWRRVLIVEPAHPEALVKLGLIEARAGNLQEAQLLHQRASRLNPAPKGLKALSQALSPAQEILPVPKVLSKVASVDAPKKEAPIQTAKKEVALKVREKVENTANSVSRPEVNREPKVRSEKWEEHRSSLEKAAQDHPGNARYLLALASHLAQRETTRREAIRQLDALNGSSLRASEIKTPWKKALLELEPQQGDQALFKSYLVRHPSSTSVVRRLTALDGKETLNPNRKTAKEESNKTVQQNGQKPDAQIKSACNSNSPCK